MKITITSVKNGYILDAPSDEAFGRAFSGIHDHIPEQTIHEDHRSLIIALKNKIGMYEEKGEVESMPRKQGGNDDL